jgi:hypothetical protein
VRPFPDFTQYVLIVTFHILAISISFEGLNYSDGTSVFWVSFNRAAQKAAVRSGFSSSIPTISSQRDFLDAFHFANWPFKIVLIFDEFSELYRAPEDVKDECLRALREIRNNSEEYAISSILAAGTFSVVHLNPKDSKLSPFNIVSGHVQSPYFTLEETRILFREFATDNLIEVEDDVIQDVWERSSGSVLMCDWSCRHSLFFCSHPGMVCLCGLVIEKHVYDLLNGSTITYAQWNDFPTNALYDEMYAYNTFRSMVRSLLSSDAKDAVDLLRCRFLGYPGDVSVLDEELDHADFLTAEGVLRKSDLVSQTYHMTSALVDGLLRRKVIAVKFRNAPPTEPPFYNSRQSVDILSALTEALKCFDKRLIHLAPSRSYKISTVVVNGSRKAQVPRESVYDTELMRILSNWFQTHHGWTVTGQWHLKTPLRKHKYTDIVLRKEGQPPTVLELLATGDRDFVNKHIDKTPEYMAILKAKEAWVIHFTREDDYAPVWQSDIMLNKGVNVVHICHNLEFTDVLMMWRWKDSAGRTYSDKQRISVP